MALTYDADYVATGRGAWSCVAADGAPPLGFLSQLDRNRAHRFLVALPPGHAGDPTVCGVVTVAHAVTGAAVDMKTQRYSVAREVGLRFADWLWESKLDPAGSPQFALLVRFNACADGSWPPIMTHGKCYPLVLRVTLPEGAVLQSPPFVIATKRRDVEAWAEVIALARTQLGIGGSAAVSDVVVRCAPMWEKVARKHSIFAGLKTGKRKHKAAASSDDSDDPSDETASDEGRQGGGGGGSGGGGGGSGGGAPARQVRAPAPPPRAAGGGLRVDGAGALGQARATGATVPPLLRPQPAVPPAPRGAVAQPPAPGSPLRPGSTGVPSSSSTAVGSPAPSADPSPFSTVGTSASPLPRAALLRATAAGGPVTTSPTPPVALGRVGSKRGRLAMELHPPPAHAAGAPDDDSADSPRVKRRELHPAQQLSWVPVGALSPFGAAVMAGEGDAARESAGGGGAAVDAGLSTTRAEEGYTARSSGLGVGTGLGVAFPSWLAGSSLDDGADVDVYWLAALGQGPSGRVASASR